MFVARLLVLLCCVGSLCSGFAATHITSHPEELTGAAEAGLIKPTAIVEARSIAKLIRNSPMPYFKRQRYRDLCHAVVRTHGNSHSAPHGGSPRGFLKSMGDLPAHRRVPTCFATDKIAGRTLLHLSCTKTSLALDHDFSDE
jgi:hypothetical protein